MSKAKKMQFQLVKGMKDILPEEQPYWELIRHNVDLMGANYGFARLDTPVLEFTNLFKRTVGEATDIVSKEMYSFVTAGGDKLSLRPENTAGVARSYIEHGMVNQPQPVKVYYLAPQFRHDNPQAGRYRQFWQFGFEAIGDKDPVIDAQLIIMSHNFLTDLGLEVEVQINSVGDSNCRPNYLKTLRHYYQDYKKDLCSDCQERLNKNTLRLLDCKNKRCQELAEQSPQFVDHLCEECKNHLMSVLEYLEEVDIKYNLNSRIVRGLDYYTKTAWEIVEAGAEGKASALGGGGRFDDLVELLGGRPTPAVGFAMGIERIVALMQEKQIKIDKEKYCDLYIAQLGVEARKKSLRLFEDLRRDGFSLAENISKKGLKDQLEVASKKHAKYTLILGQKEIADGTVLIRDMENGIQETVDFNKIKAEVRKRLSSQVMRSLKIRTKPPVV
ncbi:MAG: histidine--tRNA ligase [Parcubacteria group bacterium]|nr:MAG: histidine--tRNA ligase [Parcubacteria group bacterium]